MYKVKLGVYGCEIILLKFPEPGFLNSYYVMVFGEVGEVWVVTAGTFNVAGCNMDV